jgi:MYXO-CTERM domain-containing protein
MSVPRLSMIAVALLGTSAFAHHHHHHHFSSHHSSNSSIHLGGEPVCVKWADVAVADAGDGLETDAGDEEADAGVDETGADAGPERECVEYGPALGCSSVPGNAALGMLTLMAVLLAGRRRRI